MNDNFVDPHAGKSGHAIVNELNEALSNSSEKVAHVQKGDLTITLQADGRAVTAYEIGEALKVFDNIDNPNNQVSSLTNASEDDLKWNLENYHLTVENFQSLYTCNPDIHPCDDTLSEIRGRRKRPPAKLFSRAIVEGES